MIKDSKARITLSIPKVMIEKLAIMEETTGLTKSNLIHIAIANFLTANEILQNDDLKVAMNNSMLRIVNDMKEKGEI